MKLIESLATFPKLAIASVATLLGAQTTSVLPAEVHWLQLTVWACTAFGGFLTGILGGVGIWYKIKRYNARLDLD